MSKLDGLIKYVWRLLLVLTRRNSANIYSVSCAFLKYIYWRRFFMMPKIDVKMCQWCVKIESKIFLIDKKNIEEMPTFKWNLKELGLYFNHWWHVDDDESSFRQFPLSLPHTLTWNSLILKSSVLLEILILCPIRERFNEKILGSTRLCIFAFVRHLQSSI